MRIFIALLQKCMKRNVADELKSERRANIGGIAAHVKTVMDKQAQMNCSHYETVSAVPRSKNMTIA